MNNFINKEESFHKSYKEDMKVIQTLLSEVLGTCKQTNALVIQTKSIEEQENIVTWEKFMTTYEIKFKLDPADTSDPTLGPIFTNLERFEKFEEMLKGDEKLKPALKNHFLTSINVSSNIRNESRNISFLQWKILAQNICRVPANWWQKVVRGYSIWDDSYT